MIDARKTPRYCPPMTQPASPTPAEIIAFREARGMTQREIANALGVHAVTWSRWECGKLSVNPDRWRVLLTKQVLASAGSARDKLASVAHVIEHGTLEAAA